MTPRFLHALMQAAGPLLRMGAVAVGCCVASWVVAQTAVGHTPLPDGPAPDTDAPAWQEVWQELTTEEETDDELGTAQNNDELLRQLADHPLNVNSATRDELLQLPFLTEQQVMDLQEYLHRYGPMRSLGELRMVRSMDHRQLRLLPFFVYAGEAPPDSTRTALLPLPAAHGQVASAVRVPFYRRRGDRNGYLGYAYRHWVRASMTCGPHLSMGLTGAQDAGEPFMAAGNRWGYDAYSFYVMLRQTGLIETAIAGHYKLSAGMGLVLNNSFSLGKLAALQNLGRTARTLRPHASRAEGDYFRGAAVTLAPTQAVRLTLFASHRPIDATLNTDGSMATIVTTGYHRTPTEMQKKHNAHLASAGGSALLRRGRWHAGLTAVATRANRELVPNSAVLYRRYYARGRHFMNASLSYGYAHRSMTLSGETATDAHGALATLNTASYQPSGRLSLVLLQRYYSFRYTALHAHAFSEGGHVQNESGLYAGATWQPVRAFRLSGYADVAYFPWARYQVSRSSWARDFMAQAEWQRRRLTLKARYRLHLRQQDNQARTALERHNEHRARLALTYASGNGMWTATTQADGVRSARRAIEHGAMLSQRLTVRRSHWRAALMAAAFSTASYDTRIYVYEPQLPHEYAFPSYYGRGLRLSLTARADVGRHWQCGLRLGHTRYYDRSTIGSGLQQINAPRQTDCDVQLRWRF